MGIGINLHIITTITNFYSKNVYRDKFGKTTHFRENCETTRVCVCMYRCMEEGTLKTEFTNQGTL
jgi:hypothetical protein